MKFILFFLINTVFADMISEWIDLNNHIINSKSYKISFKQEQEAVIGGLTHYTSIPGNIIYFNDNIRYESDDRIIIINRDSLKILNKYSNQIFIDNNNKKYNLLLSASLSDMLLKSQFISSNDVDYYYIKDKDIESKIYFLNKNIIKVDIFHDNFIIELSDIELSTIDTNEAINYFQIGSNLSEIFDLRIK